MIYCGVSSQTSVSAKHEKVKFKVMQQKLCRGPLTLTLAPRLLYCRRWWGWCPPCRCWCTRSGWLRGQSEETCSQLGSCLPTSIWNWNILSYCTPYCRKSKDCRNFLIDNGMAILDNQHIIYVIVTPSQVPPRLRLRYSHVITVSGTRIRQWLK